MYERKLTQFERNFHEQQEGTAMNPSSPFLANIFIGKFDPEIMKKLQYYSSTLGTARSFCFISTRKSVISRILSLPNNKFPRIKFIFEGENKEQLSLLGVLVIRIVPTR